MPYKKIFNGIAGSKQTSKHYADSSLVGLGRRKQFIRLIGDGGKGKLAEQEMGKQLPEVGMGFPFPTSPVLPGFWFGWAETENVCVAPFEQKGDILKHNN